MGPVARQTRMPTFIQLHRHLGALEFQGKILAWNFFAGFSRRAEGSRPTFTCSISSAKTAKFSYASAWPMSGSALAPISSVTGSPKAFRELKVQRISHCETLQVGVAFAVVEQALEGF
jgi:hypothetical protein